MKMLRLKPNLKVMWQETVIDDVVRDFIASKSIDLEYVTNINDVRENDTEQHIHGKATIKMQLNLNLLTLKFFTKSLLRHF